MQTSDRMSRCEVMKSCGTSRCFAVVMSDDEQTGEVGRLNARVLCRVGLSKPYTALLGTVNPVV